MSPKTLLTLPPGIMPPVHFGQAEGRVVRRDHDIACGKGNECAAVTVAVHHGNARFTRPVEQFRGPSAMRRGCPETCRRILIGLAKILLEIPSGAPAVASAGEHDDLGVFVGLQSKQDFLHLDMQCRAHGIAFFRPVERDTRDPFLVGIDENTAVFLLLGHRILPSPAKLVDFPSPVTKKRC